jgi:hypothetical protein
MSQNSSYDNLINELQNIDNENLTKDLPDKIMFEENKTICRLIRIHLREFYDDICIPYNFFNNEGWNVDKVLYNNENVLFYNKKYIDDADKKRFDFVFNKYVNMLKEIFIPTNVLQVYLKKWTDTSSIKWKSNADNSYLKTLLTEGKYQYISPSYTSNLFYVNCKKYGNDITKIRDETEKTLNDVVKNVKKEISQFKKNYNGIVKSYVYKCPHDMNEINVFSKTFIRSTILEIMNLIEKMVDLHVYAIHPIVENIIGDYISFDTINNYSRNDNDGKFLYIV